MDQTSLPFGTFETIKDWLDSEGDSWAGGNMLKKIHGEFPVPQNAKLRPPCPPSWYPNQFSGGDVSVIPNGRIWGKNGAILTPDNYLIGDVSFEGVHITSENHSIFKQKGLPSVSHYKNVADLTHVYSGNYYHYMYEVLPRIDLLHQSNLTINYYVVNEGFGERYQSETLKRLGIDERQLVPTHDHFHLQAEKLIVPSQPSFPTKWAYEFLRKTFSNPNTSSSDKKRIFIKRRWSRNFTNIDQLVELLEGLGFVTLELEDLSVANQVEIFSSAEIVIAAHGAGLTNLTFCQPGTKVLEIFAPTYIIPHYWAISALGNLRYHYLIGEPKDSSSGVKNEWAGGDNITVDIDKLKTYIEENLLA
ncbi:capsular biosynthesis protein [Pontibacillus chungwhensis BH030062]|uniref:Capsular biosynthesis protein n=1 Tax=Pontibacillus chungwhensis BH030062 TaxID=1385513 RepID=A0A0A2VBP3_9BACI|nr:glycosyltransferase family 61 protein [Pontibacillus chungwhensis]KGP91095.1 capsular biosynthesis protein [Pontibacillus chungwhensis BH030062]